MSLPAPLPVPLGVALDAPCWSAGTDESPVTSFEATLAQPELFITQGLGRDIEELRLLFMQSVAENSNAVRAARIIVQLAYDPEVQALVRPVMPLPEHVFFAPVCGRRRLVDILHRMRPRYELCEAALQAVVRSATLPAPYGELLGVKLRSASPRSQVSAIAAILCLGAFNV